MEDQRSDHHNALQSDRRAFLVGCGKYSLTVPPAMTMLLSTTLASPAIARSGGGEGSGNGSGDGGGRGNDGGNGGHDGGSGGGSAGSGDGAGRGGDRGHGDRGKGDRGKGGDNRDKGH